MRDPALYLFDDPDECVPASMKTVQWLMARGVSLADAVAPWCVHGGHVTFNPDAPRYSPCAAGTAALIFAVCGEDGIMDAAAWAPSLGRIGTRLGVGAMLGEAQIGIDGLGSTGLPISIWRSPLPWLMAGRNGLVVVDPALAAHRLAGCAITGEDLAHNAELQRSLTVAPPVLAPSHRELRHAA